jgi:hypothetical protein
LTDSSLLSVIELEEQVLSIDEVIVTPQNNPALRIIRKVLDNKSSNNFENYSHYTYRNYHKLVGDIKHPITDANGVMSKYDSAMAKQFSGMVMMVSETMALCSKSGSKVEEKILATHLAGSTTYVFGQTSYAAFHKAISFYNHSVNIIGSPDVNEKMSMEYLSPLSNGSLSAYNFQLENEAVTADNDTLFRISYFPKKGKNFNGLMGTMFISSNGYALASIIAHPYEKGWVDFSFKQDYERIDGRWFPTDMEEELAILMTADTTKKKPKTHLVFRISSKIDSVSFDAPQKKLRSLDRVYLDEKSVAHSVDLIRSLRPVPLLPREENNYRIRDSILAKESISDYDIISNLMPKLAEGKLPVKKVDIDLPRFYSSNDYEKTRWGLGLHTNERLMKYVSIGGYIGYGTKDEQVKYGGEVELVLNRSRSVKLAYSYQNTLKGVGNGIPFNLTETYFRTLAAARFEGCIENKIAGSWHILPSLKINALVSVTDVAVKYAYAYKGSLLTNYRDDKVQLSLRYAVGESYLMIGVTRLPISVGNPIFYATYTRGADFLRGSAAYNKLEASIDIVAYNGRIGQSNLRLGGGYIDRSLPYGMLFTGEGSKSKNVLSFVVRNSFQTMRPDEFLSDRYAHLF